MNPLLSILVGVALLPGHATLVIASHNWWYGRLIGRRITDFVQVIHLVFLLLFSVYLFPRQWPFLPWGMYWGPFYLAAAFLGLVMLVWTTILRNLRREPPEIVRKGIEILTPSGQLGYPGQGIGLRGLLAKLPGNEVLRPVIEFSEIHSAIFPSEWDGLKILHLSDLHFRGTPTREWFQVVLKDCARHEPDLIVLTGDIVDGLDFHHWVGGTLGRFSKKIHRVGILGNHDTWYEPRQLLKILQAHDYQMVGGREKVMLLKGVPVRFVGSERPWRGGVPDFHGDHPEMFTIALCHSPDEASWAANSGAKLIFAGHVHGGQVRMPFVGPIIMPSRHGRHFDKGWFRVGDSLMHVSSGLGGSQPIRWRCPPEVSLITLRLPKIIEE